MKQEYKTLVEMVRNRNKETIAEADNNPDKWYEMYVIEGEDRCTHTVESADTFDEVVQYVEKYAEQYKLDNINIDIWECRDNPNDIFALFDAVIRTAQPTIDFNFMLRIAYWVSSYGMDEGLSLELFNDTYGTAMGKHYYDKWEHLYHHNIMKMIMYFGLDTKEGEKFCTMVQQQMLKYEKRIGRNG